ncbi:Phage shock protein E [uncultured Gammaproteobacteria bacterium]|jgi:phage shock protein E|uniref:Rhodanese-related sulfurtransferase n=3 Tax=sulfur-oxidizing symbionts TaxID=32036 RepID=A0A1H6MMX9_9GAMM|nr:MULTISPECIES: rhodanese-like domain-containing protein [Gammaproteobacteria]CAC9480781.1 Phage shock protein E [uncultured Gammaproteobacteria bacterium]CAB5503419.1 Phage shock protein E [Bathymodiolus azoricus thioautotrophic gill symbiont]CAB5508005.1 Phage shock protein E [Bathymodiolus thermophilus thioautotrophic gill symbiont]CAC9490461.1 Phage shock protein E [uncultured Gammaproteobacteria bacterium]CAC9494825.1 Phage shock protein E [uncultured Gammaproteobacteria bacterium]
MFNSFSGKDACKLLADGAQLVDVRSSTEFSQGALPNAINLPLQSIMNAKNILNQDKAIVLYCVSGARSSTAKNYLVQMGFDNVNDLGSFRNYNCE